MIDPSINLDFNGDLHKKVLKNLDKRFTMSANRMQSLHRKWRKAEDQFVAYIPESDTDAKKRSARENTGKQDYTTIILPQCYADINAAQGIFNFLSYMWNDPSAQNTIQATGFVPIPAALYSIMANNVLAPGDSLGAGAVGDIDIEDGAICSAAGGSIAGR